MHPQTKKLRQSSFKERYKKRHGGSVKHTETLCTQSQQEWQLISEQEQEQGEADWKLRVCSGVESYQSEQRHFPQ